MITDSQYYTHVVKCSLCHHEIKERATLYPTGFEVKIVCVDCYRRFSEKEIELIANLLRAFGGYFGQYRRGTISIVKILKAIHTDLLSVYKDAEAVQINIRMLHKALLHGITPNEYIANLELIFKD
jgi:hypothetical protein